MIYLNTLLSEKHAITERLMFFYPRWLIIATNTKKSQLFYCAGAAESLISLQVF